MSISPIKSGLTAVISEGKRELLHEYTYEVFSDKLPTELDGIKVLHLSDLHTKLFGRHNLGLAEICRSVSPDIICFTGDAFSRNEELSDVMDKPQFMKALAEIAPTYYIRGNHENDRPELAKPFESELRKIGIHLLNNKSEHCSQNGASINITGVVLPRECYRLPNGSYYGLKKVTPALLHELVGQPDRSRFNLLLAHTPLPFHAYAAWGADLTLSGHIHGGIVRIGGVGLLSPERRFFPRYTKHLYRIKTPNCFSCMEVSAGLGKTRIHNPASISVCILRRYDK